MKIPIAREEELYRKRNHTLALRHFIFKITRLIVCVHLLYFLLFYSCWLMKWFQIDCCLYCLLALEDTCQKKFEGESRHVMSVEIQHNLLNILKEHACQLSMSEWQRIEIWSIRVRLSIFFAIRRVIGHLSTMILWYDESVGEIVAKNILFDCNHRHWRTCEHIRDLYDDVKVKKLHNLSLKPRTKHSSRAGKVFDLFHAIHSFFASRWLTPGEVGVLFAFA